VLTHKYFGGNVPTRNQLYDIDRELIEKLKEFPAKIAQSIETYRFREALSTLMDFSRTGNKYLADTEPWKLAKTDISRVQTILNLALQVAANLSIVMEPFLPFSSRKLKDMLNLPELKWKDTGNAALLQEGQPINENQILFEKIEDAVIEAQVQKLLDTKKANELAGKPLPPSKPEVTFEDFTQMDIRIATILAAELVPKTKKLLKLTLDTGLDKRTVVSGIAEHYKPEEIIGKQVSLLANLAPREIKGIQSQGMILMAENKDGSLAFISPEKSINNGGTVS
jgi:methionyl-tRNA synthetase